MGSHPYGATGMGPYGAWTQPAGMMNPYQQGPVMSPHAEGKVASTVEELSKKIDRLSKKLSADIPLDAEEDDDEVAVRRISGAQIIQTVQLLVQQNEKYKVTAASKTDRVDGLLAKVTELHEKNQKYMEENAKLLTERYERSQASDEAESKRVKELLETVAEGRAAVTDVEEKLAAAEGDRDAKQEELDRVRSLLNDTTTSLSTANSQLAVANQRVAALELEGSERDAAIKQGYDSQIAELTANVASLTEKNTTLEAQVESLSVEKKAVEEEKSQLATELAEVRSSTASLASNQEESTSKIAELDTELASLRAQLSSKDERIQQLETEAAESQAAAADPEEVTRLQEKLAAAVARVAELKEEVEHAEEDNNEILTQSKDRIAKLKNRMVELSEEHEEELKSLMTDVYFKIEEMFEDDASYSTEEVLKRAKAAIKRTLLEQNEEDEEGEEEDEEEEEVTDNSKPVVAAVVVSEEVEKTEPAEEPEVVEEEATVEEPVVEEIEEKQEKKKEDQEDIDLSIPLIPVLVETSMTTCSDGSEGHPMASVYAFESNSIPNLYEVAADGSTLKVSYSESGVAYNETAVTVGTAECEVELHASDDGFQVKFNSERVRKWGVDFAASLTVTHSKNGRSFEVYLPGTRTYDPAGTSGDPHASERIGGSCSQTQMAITAVQVFAALRGASVEGVRVIQDAFAPLIERYHGRITLFRWMFNQVKQTVFDQTFVTPYPEFIRQEIAAGRLSVDEDERAHSRTYLSSWERGEPVPPIQYYRKLAAKEDMKSVLDQDTFRVLSSLISEMPAEGNSGSSSSNKSKKKKKKKSKK